MSPIKEKIIQEDQTQHLPVSTALRPSFNRRFHRLSFISFYFISMIPRLQRTGALMTPHAFPSKMKTLGRRTTSMQAFPPNKTFSKTSPTSPLSTTPLPTFPLPLHNPLHPSPPPLWEPIFSLDLEEGHCVGIHLLQDPTIHPLELPSSTMHLTDQFRTSLHPDEIAFGESLKGTAGQLTFYLGRLAMRTAISSLEKHQGVLSGSAHGTSILKDQYGRPIVPKGLMGSISHKRMTGVALVGLDPCVEGGVRRGIGVDIEQKATRRQSIANRVLTRRERDDLGKIQGVTEEEEVLLRFSLKESFYKAIHPLICQKVGFQEAEMTPHSDGTASIVPNLKSGAHHSFSNISAHWRTEGEFFLTSVSVDLKPEV